jgi:hypothetical protein
MFMASLQDAFAIYVCFLILAIAASFGNQLPTSAFSGSIQRAGSAANRAADRPLQPVVSR